MGRVQKKRKTPFDLKGFSIHILLRMKTFLSLFLFAHLSLLAEESFLIIERESGDVLYGFGAHLNERMTPCSTFKIALSLIGFESGLLINEHQPRWSFQEGYDDFLEVWKEDQTPLTWIQRSCVWYSNVLVSQLGHAQLQNFLLDLDYGNHDISGGLANVWIRSSLKISPMEQVEFIRRMLSEELPLTQHAIEMTKGLLLIERGEEWSLFGKTGWSGSSKKVDGINEITWFLGWLEKEGRSYPLVYNIKAPTIDLGRRVPRVKELLEEVGLIPSS